MLPPTDTLPAAILFDMDGTLIDTEPFWMAAEAELVAAHGGSWSDEQAHALVGSALENSAAVLQAAGVRLTVPEIIAALNDAVLAGLGDRMPWRPGARELLAQARAAGVPTALVTMSHRAMAEKIVAALPADSFDLLVTGDEVARGKPHPEPYLTAARLLGVDIAGAIAIEDSTTGLAAAEASGARAVGVPHVAAIAPAEGRVLLDTLAGVSLDRLVALAPNARADS